MKQRLTQLSLLNDALLGNTPIVLLFTSDYCHACCVLEEQISQMMERYVTTLYFELKRGDVPGIEKAFHLVSTPALVFISANKHIVCERRADQLTLHQLKLHLEETHETNRSLFL